MIKVIKSIPTEVEKVVFIGDTHHPFQDKVAIRLMLSFIRWFQPQFIYLIGDIIDMYAVSSYSKDANKASKFQLEIDATIEFLHHVKNACPDAEIAYKDGNHEDRLVTYIKKHEEMAGLKALTIPALLELDSLGITHQGYRGYLSHHNFLVEHGDRVSVGSAMTAKKMFERRQNSGISGHTHRLGAHHRTTLQGHYTWYENGCLCHMDPEYINGTPDWQHGFSIGHYLLEEERMVIDQIPIINGSLFYQGKLFKVS